MRTLSTLWVLVVAVSVPSLAGDAAHTKTGRSPPTAEEKKAMKLTGDVKRGEWAYAVCIGCHQTNGAGTEDGRFPRLTGQHPSVLTKEIADIRGRVREAPVMHPLAKTLVDPQELADTVAYIGTLPPPKSNGQGPGIELAEGKALYAKDCVTCHGAGGMGDAAKQYPVLAGQHDKYLLQQAVAIRDGQRKNAHRDMAKIIKGYSEKQIDAVADYLSRLPLTSEAATAGTR